MQKFEDYLPNGYTPAAIKRIPKEMVVAAALELGMDERTPAAAVAKALRGSAWKCKVCGAQTTLISFNQGFREFCSTKCSNNSPDVIAEKQRVSLARYGTAYPLQAAAVKLKIGSSKLEAHEKRQQELTRYRLKSFLSSEGVDFSAVEDYLSLKDGTIRIYPLDNISEYRWTDRATFSYFQRVSVENEKNGIRTIWIKPWEFAPGSRQEAVLKSCILTAAGKIRYVFNGRDCEVRELGKGELRPFLEVNSFYGYRAATLNLGLYLKKRVGDFEKGTLLMLYTFGHPFFGGKKKKYDLEVIRASTLLNCQVRGGASKLFKHFVLNHPTVRFGDRELEWNKIVYYVDYDHNSGNSLPHLGFHFVAYSSPGFMNVNSATGAVTHRKPMEHAAVKAQIARGELFSVPNAGVKVFTFTKAAEIRDGSDFVGE